MMDFELSLKEAKKLIVAKQTEQAHTILTNALAALQSQPPDTLSQTDRLLLESEIQEGLADTKILERQDQEALSHLVAAMTQLETLELPPTAVHPNELLFRVFRKMAGAFDRLGQQFEGEKYLRKAGEIKAYLLTAALRSRFSKAGYKVQENVRAIVSEATPVDLVAEKGGFKKKRVAIWFAMDESEVDTISYLTKGYKKFAKDRYIFLLMGTATIPSLSGARVVNSIEQIAV
ncbi:MAG: hypothetical protein ACFFFG_02065 [Candidatus Thorarchaeota archaeon]